ncbi:MAG TPA: DinB family protein [Lysobacter sp.]
MDKTTLNALALFPLQLEAHYAAIPPAFRHWTPPSWDGIPSERFTAIEQLCHVHDIEVEGYQERIRRTLEEAHPLLPSIDSEPLALERRYGDADADAVLAAFRDARARTVATIAALDEAQLARTAEFEGYGPLTLRSLVHYLCSHDQQHLSGLQWLLGKIDAQRVASA